MAAATANLRVSLEPHLVESLTPLQAILPKELAEQVAQSLLASSIPYDTLIEISKWSRSEPGQKALEAHSLSPGDYNTISLLAGATTAPDGKFGDYTPPPDRATVEKHKTRERKAITTLVNGVFSVLGVGFAAWWATARTGWIDEWRVLFSFFAAIVVAIAEAGMYLIWQTRNDKPGRVLKKKRRPALHKKVDVEPPTEPPASSTEPPTQDDSTTLRHRGK